MPSVRTKIARFLAHQALLDDDLGTGRAEGAGEAVLDGGGGSLARLGHRDALAGRQAVGLDDDGDRLGFQVGERRCLVLEAAIGGGRNAELGAEILGKALGAFELGCGLRWPEHLDPRGGEIVGQAGHQRHLGPDHHKADIAIAAEADDGGVVGGIERHALGHLGDAGIAGRAIEPGQQGARGNGPGQGMLAPAGTDQ